MAELIIVVVLLGILGAITTLGLGNVVPAARQEAAITRARLLNASRLSFALTVPGAAARWDAVPDSSSRLALLVDGGVLEAVDSSYLNMAGAYQLEVSGALGSKTRVVHEGIALEYSQ